MTPTEPDKEPSKNNDNLDSNSTSSQLSKDYKVGDFLDGVLDAVYQHGHFNARWKAVQDPKKMGVWKEYIDQHYRKEIIRGQLSANESYLQLFIGLEENAILPKFAEFAKQLKEHADKKKAELLAELSRLEKE